jgi:RNA polymerase sigma-70 factor (ECF subfamily)
MHVDQQLYHELKRFVASRIKNHADAEDIVQEVFIKAQEKGTQLKEAEKFTAWMYQITRNSMVDYFRAKKRTLPDDAWKSQEEYNLFTDCVAHCLQLLMHQLPSPYREALLMAEVEQIPQKELAEKLGLSYSGLKSRVQRGRQLLKEKINALYVIRTDGYGNVLHCEDRVPCGCDSYATVQQLNSSSC